MKKQGSIGNYPFTAISAQQDFKLALILCMIDPSLGGVLVLGDKGTGKTTTVRALSNLMSITDADFSFVNLPIGATEDRVLGSVKLDILINEKRLEIQKGLLAKANNGILYIDEINLLNDYLMDVLLDAASSGGYYLERDSISQWMESKFCLIGTMNPEEGELRPQLLDRFGLAVTVKTPVDKAIRMEITKRRLNFDSDPLSFLDQYTKEEIQLSAKIQTAKTNLIFVNISESIREKIAELCMEHKVEGLRADILLMKAARAYAAYHDQKEVNFESIEKIQDFVLLHRSKANSQNTENQELKQNTKQDSSSNQKKDDDSSGASGLTDYLANASKTQQYLKMDGNGNFSERGLKYKSLDPKSSRRQNNINRATAINLLETVKEYAINDKLTLKYRNAVSKTEIRILFLIDSSSSMLQNRQIDFVKGMMEQTTKKYRQKEVSYSVVAISNGTGKVIIPKTTYAEDLMNEIKKLRSGGKTNLTSGLKLVYQLLKEKEIKMSPCHLFILTDGQINAGETSNPFQEAVTYYKTFLKSMVKTTLVDMEKGFIRLGLAKQFAEQINSQYQSPNCEA